MGKNNTLGEMDFLTSFPFLLTSIYKQASSLLEHLYEDAIDEPELPEKDEKPKDKQTEEDKEVQDFLDDVTNGINYFYSDEYDTYKGLNDGSDVDKKVKGILDDFIFRIKIHQPDFNYKVAFNFTGKNGEVLKFRFFWNHDFDRFEGTCNKFDEVFYYDEMKKVFGQIHDEEFMGDAVPEDVVKDLEEEKKEYVAPKCEVKEAPKKAAQVTVQEIEPEAPATAAQTLYDSLNKERGEKKEKYVEEVEAAAKRIIDYKMFTPLTNEDGVIDQILFDADDLTVNIPHEEFGDYETVLTLQEILDIIKNRLGFKEVTYDTLDETYTARLV